MAAVRGVTASMSAHNISQQRFYQHVIALLDKVIMNVLTWKFAPPKQGTHTVFNKKSTCLRLPVAELPGRDLMHCWAVETRPAKRWHQGIQAVSNFNEHSQIFSHIMSTSWKSRTHRKRQGRTFAPRFRPGWTSGQAKLQDSSNKDNLPQPIPFGGRYLLS